MIAHQVAAKAARDSLFLSRFPATALPAIMAVAAVTAVTAGVLFARLLTRRGPIAVLPFSLLLSVALHIAEYSLIGTFSKPVAVFTYLHIVGFGAILLSAFWSFASEAFDLREAKRVFGRITGAGTAGGVAGGLIAERVASLAGPEALLILTGILHLAAALVFFAIGRLDHRRAGVSEEFPSFSTAAVTAIRRAPFLRNLALLVLLSTISAALLDFLLKSGAVQNFGRGPALARFFALFYTTNQVIAFVVQVGISPFVLRTFGLGRSVMALPTAVFAGACGSLLVPLFPVSVIVRAVEAILRTSLFRSGYELFFTPIPATEKRAVKTAIDVGCDRLGDALGAGVLQILLLFGPTHAFAPMLFITAAIALVSIGIARQMDRAYLNVLQNGLLNRAIELEHSDIRDATTLLGFTRVLPAVPRPAIPAPAAAPAPTTDSIAAPDTSMQRLRELRSRDLARIQRAIENPAFDTLLVPQAIKLLAWNDAKQMARGFLEQHLDKVGGQLVDVLLDGEQDFAIRRRIPRILSRSGRQHIVDGLTEALSDARFDIRFAASRALESVHRQQPGLRFDAGYLMQVVTRELSVSKNIWEGRRLLDQRDEMDSQYLFLDEVLKDRANCSLEHVFSLLAIFIPYEPLKLAFRAIHNEDPFLRGLGLEYLEATLNPEVFALLSQLMETSPAKIERRPPEQVLDQLMAQESIKFRVKPQVSDAPAPDGPPPQAKPA